MVTRIVSPTTATAPQRSSRTPLHEQKELAEKPGTDLTRIPNEYDAPAEERALNRPLRPLAAFIAHLIATDRRLPQTRELRRAEPTAVTAAYDAATTRPHDTSRTKGKSL